MPNRQRLRPPCSATCGVVPPNLGVILGRRWVTSSSWRSQRSLAGSPSAPKGTRNDPEGFRLDWCGVQKGGRKTKKNNYFRVFLPSPYLSPYGMMIHRKFVRRIVGPPPGTNWSAWHEILHEWNMRVDYWVHVSGFSSW